MLSNTLFLESKIEKTNDNAKLDKVGKGIELNWGSFYIAVKILSVKPPPLITEF